MNVDLNEIIGKQIVGIKFKENGVGLILEDLNILWFEVDDPYVGIAMHVEKPNSKHRC